jgi:cell division septum initiation protein DivIVA
VPTKSEIDDFEIVLNEIEVIEKKIENLELELANKKKSIFT